ncbi:MAG: potassium channel family protein [Candidatus Ornithospirochaeta sp.]
MSDNLFSSKRVIIVGSYIIERAIASNLLKKGCSVTVVSDDINDAERLAEIKGMNVINGDGTMRSTLEDASIDKADILISATESDEKNLTIAEIGKKFYGVKKTIALLEDGNKSSFFYKMGVDRVISPLNMLSSIMEEESLKENISSHFPEGLILNEIVIHKGSSLINKKLWELNLPKEIIICCILRGDKNLIPRGNTTVLENDVLLVLSSDKDILDSLASSASI